MLLVAGTVVTAVRPWERAVELELFVVAERVWTPTGVRCRTGQHVEIRASGEVLHDEASGATTGPEGLVAPEAHLWNVPGLPDANTAALIARIDDGKPWVVGEHDARTCSASGELQLGVNDWGTWNNAGAWDVVVRVSRAGPGGLW